MFFLHGLGLKNFKLSLFFMVSLIGVSDLVFGQDDLNQDRPVTITNPEVSEPVYPEILDLDLRDLPIHEAWQAGDPIKEIPRRMTSLPGEAQEPVAAEDELLSLQEGALLNDNRAFNLPDINRNGQGYSGVNPPDTVGDVGVDYYIQSINGSGGATYVVYNKGDGSIAAGPFSMDSLGSNQCATGLGDPIVLYDELASRWMISEFSNSGNRMCVYISQTSNPVTGGWYAYNFTGNSFPDYPKYGVWSDAYYVGTNESSLGVYAFDRAAMLAGNAATSQRFSTSGLSGFGFQILMPADLDGSTAPPNGSPGIFMRHNDNEAHGGSTGVDWLEIFSFSVDWNTPSNSSLTGPIRINIAEIDSSLCGLVSFNCFPQPGTSTTLDPLREVVMNRLAYRNFGSHQSLVGNLVTDVNGSNRGGIRWFELRNTGSGWSLYQEGTWSPDAVNRWMGGIAMDGSGNIALAYNVSSSSVYPGLRYAGRLDGDTLNTLTQGEHTIVNGTGSNGSNRYGDYAAMSVDPVDNCTFWFTGQYNTGSQWSTRIASFRFDSCGSGLTIPDTNFRNFLLQNYDSNNDSQISAEEAAAVTGTMNCSSKNIADLSGIEHFTGITGLDCRSNQLTSLPSLSSLTGLRNLWVSYNQLTSLPDLSSLNLLQALYCSGNQLTSLPSLSALSNLQVLWCNSNSLTSLPSLTGLNNLVLIYCQYNQLTGVPDLSGVPALNYFNCSRNLFDSGDCANIATVTARGLASFIFNPQANGSNLDCSSSSNINIPDSNFKTFLVTNYDSNNDSEISAAEAAAVTGTINCSSKSIANLTGIESFVNITGLDCRSNQLTSLPTLSSLTKLVRLWCSFNPLGSLPSLSALTGLKELYCSGCQLTSLPSLSALTALQVLWCNSNQLTSIPSLSGLNSLVLLYCQDNLLANLPDLSVLPVINYFICSRNLLDAGDCADIATIQARNLTVFTFNPQAKGNPINCDVLSIPDANFKAFLVANYDTNLDNEISSPEALAVTSMTCSSQNIASLSGIENFINLTSLDCRSNLLTSLPNLSSLTKLRRFWCSFNQLTSLPSLAALTDLRELYCSGNQLSSLPDLSSLTLLQVLWCNSNNLTALPNMSGLNSLVLLYCQYNQMTSVPDVSGLPALNFFSCFRNYFDIQDCASIAVVEARSLTSFIYNPQANGSVLACNNVSIPDTNFRDFLLANYDSNLNGVISNEEAQAVTGTMNCSGQGIADLSGIEYFINLSGLDCRNNQLTTLPSLANLAGLKRLWCSNNQLTSLPSLSSNTALKELYFNGNQLTSLPSLSSLLALQVLWCNNNNLTSIPSLSGLNNLVLLYCHYNQLTSLPDVSVLPAINYFYCYRNQFDSGDCSAIQAVEARGLAVFGYNPQANGSTLSCAGDGTSGTDFE